MDMAKIGHGVADGNNRQTLSDEDSKARALPVYVCARKMLRFFERHIKQGPVLKTEGVDGHDHVSLRGRVASY